MHILVSNDDGYFSAGITCLRQGLEKTGHRVTMIAPERNNSACGMSITVREPVQLRQLDERGYAVSGTPVDCVGIGLSDFLDEPVDMVISGINNGANLADDVLYSGTVAAAVEARRLRYPNIAISVTSLEPHYYDTALQVVLTLLDRMQDQQFDPSIGLLNINVPDVSMEQLKGIRISRLGERESPDNPVFTVAGDGNQQVKMGAAGAFMVDENDSAFLFDYDVVAEGYASVTPIQAKYIDQPYLESMQRLLFKTAAGS